MAYTINVPELHPNLRAVPKYNPVFWHEEYDYLLEQQPSWQVEILLKHFDANIQEKIRQCQEAER